MTKITIDKEKLTANRHDYNNKYYNRKRGVCYICGNPAACFQTTVCEAHIWRGKKRDI